MTGYKYYVKQRMEKFMASMKEPIDGMWLWEELGLMAYTRDLWENLAEEEKRGFEEAEAEAEKRTYREVSTQTD
jgi:hypothetical protein